MFTTLALKRTLQVKLQCFLHFFLHMSSSLVCEENGSNFHRLTWSECLWIIGRVFSEFMLNVIVSVK